VSVLQPGRNCWRIEPADQVAFVVDGADYYRAFYDVVCQAAHHILIVGWDLDSRIDLLRPQKSPDHTSAPPTKLGDCLRTLVQQRPNLEIYILAWDFAMVYALEREWVPQFKIPWRSHSRLHVHMDNQHPPGGCHHQKVVVVDDVLAFVGGLDLTRSRWDTPEHRVDDPRRTDPNGDPYAPFHDVQMMVQGAIASSLGDLARERWQRATGRQIQPPPQPSHDRSLWPSWIQTDVKQTRVAISRTLPAFQDQSEVQEIQQLYLDAIASARQVIYLENQFLTSHVIGNALAECLQQPEGPEILILLRRDGGDWLEQVTMDVLRARIVRQLRKADQYGRLEIAYPNCPALPDGSLSLHSKVMVVDDTFLQIGSANLTNRSMALDSECNLAIAADGREDVRRAIAGFRIRLLAEHLGVPEQKCESIMNTEPSILYSLTRMRGTHRGLTPFDHELVTELDSWIPDSAIVDPEKPMEPDLVLNHFIHPDDREPASRQLMGMALVLGILGLVAAAWRWTPLSEWIDVWAMTALLETFKDSPWTPIFVLVGFMIGSLIMIPITGMILISFLAFGPWVGSCYALVGSALGAAVTYGMGNWLGKEKVRQLAGSKINRLSQYVGERGLLSMVLAHMLPVGPFTIVNMLAGASHIEFRDYMIGTLLGMLPGIIVLALLSDRVIATIRSPDLWTTFLLVGVIVFILSGIWLIAHLLRKRAPKSVASIQSQS